MYAGVGWGWFLKVSALLTLLFEPLMFETLTLSAKSRATGAKNITPMP